ncbi:NFACT RNA binding domain-containing protein [Marinilactibacillus sp. Marseille-P9653]|uniref:NFACT RNA binding domain-containing protein n=1 Tax=Marinilactibacillus sp. Marseille-P9653 TaxID=2866583 RepID=UPI001CE4A51A|nr:NFACT RNA binding domain-containing protein [Marinilactibacillus sp. Marseille-P9653]
MSFDGLFTHAMVEELKQELIGGRVAKIQQPYENEILFKIRSRRKNKQLLLSAHPQYARMQLTEIPFENPSVPPQFCMVMRKYLDGAILEDIIQLENDRVIEFSFSNRNELGDIQNLVLIVEIMGRHSNILLVNKQEEKIYETIRHISPSQNTYRSLLPGGTYIEAPRQDKANPFTYESTLPIRAVSFKDKVKWIQDTFQGMGRDSAEELAHQVETHPDDAPTAVFAKFMAPYKMNQVSPTLTINNRKEQFSAVEYPSLPGEKESYATLSELADRYFGNKAERDRVQQQANDLFGLVKTETDRNRKKLVKLEKEFQQTQKADQYRIKGEVLTAYLHEIQQGMESVDLDNFYEENQKITIDLDPRKSPSKNAQAYFSRYQKFKNAIAHLNGQIAQTKAEIHYLESVLTQMEVASPKDIEEIRDELQSGGYIKKKRKPLKGKKKLASEPDQFVSSDGTSILVGKNNLQNDQLTLKIARKTDWWLHTKDIPGSHVIIRSDSPSEQTLEEAATIAAYFSKYRLSASVPVDAVQVKHVKKPNGAKPGFVIYEGQTTYYVTPTDDLIKALRK